MKASSYYSVRTGGRQDKRGEVKMEISILLFWQILSMFLMLLMGFALVKTGILKAQDSKTLSVLLLYLALPCAILDSFQVEYDSGILRGLMLAFAAAAICHVILLLAAGLLGKALHLTAVEKASVIYSNSSNLIIPIITAVLGPKWVVCERTASASVDPRQGTPIRHKRGRYPKNPHEYQSSGCIRRNYSLPDRLPPAGCAF